MNSLRRFAVLLVVCGCGGGGGSDPGGGGSCPLSPALVASPGTDRSVATRAVVQLDGTDSIMRSGTAVLFRWTLSSRPAGSAAALSATTDPRPTFTADRDGAYVLALVVTDGRSCSAPATLTVTAANVAPVVNAGPARTVNLPGAVTLDGTATTDANGDALAYEWTVSSAPDGASPALTGADGATASFTPDLEGRYVLRLRASDGRADGTGEVVVDAYRPVAVLGFGVVDAEYSTSLDLVVAVSATPAAALHLLDGATGADTVVALAAAPTCVGVTPDGRFAAVGHESSITWVDLTAASVVTTVATAIDGVFDVAADDYGRVFVFPAHSSDHVRTIDVSTRTDTYGSSVWTAPRMKAKLVPSRMKLYAVDAGISPPEMEAHAISGGVASYLWPWRYWDGSHDHCGDLWPSADGWRIYTRCGEVFQPGVTELGDMLYTGRLGNAALASGEQLAWLSESVSANELAVLSVPPAGGGDPELRTYVATTMAPASSRALAKLGVGGVAHATHGRFVFHRSDATERYVLVSIDDAGALASDAGLIVY